MLKGNYAKWIRKIKNQQGKLETTTKAVPKAWRNHLEKIKNQKWKNRTKMRIQLMVRWLQVVFQRIERIPIEWKKYRSANT